MKKGYNKILYSIAVFTMTLLFFSCGSDNDEPKSLEPQEYSIEIMYKGDMVGYDKRAFITGGGFNSSETTIIDDLTGKDLLMVTLEDDNHVFKEYNKFSLSKKVQFFTFKVGARRVSQWGNASPLTVTVKVYRNGKLMDTFEKTATQTMEISIEKDYYEGDM